MEKNNQPYDQLQKDLFINLALYSLLKGQGGMFIFLWVIGIALFLPLSLPPLAILGWTAAITALGILATRDYLRNRSVMAAVLRNLAEKRYPSRGIADAALSESLEKGKVLFGEIAAKVLEIEGANGENYSLRLVLADTDAMIQLAYESARQVGEYERVLSMVTVPTQRANLAAAGDLKKERTIQLRADNISLVTTKAKEARRLVTDIFQQLEILLLQVFQLDKDAADVVRTAEFAQSTENLLKKIQGEVDAQRQAAKRVVEIISGV